ncbi:MAG: aminomethyl-transferring glycine dehydrogenase subunit GcvPB [Planctomycetota bacterium]
MDKNQSAGLLFEIGQPGRRCHAIPEASRVDAAAMIPGRFLSESPPPLPELSELDIVRHFTNLSTLNMAIDCNFYPLGSCTMKYNPKRHERLVGSHRFAEQHPLQPDSTCQGTLGVLHEMERILAEIAGLDACSLQPSAGAQGELTSLLVAAAWFRHRGEARSKVLIPDSAHGTNPASAALAGFQAVGVKSTADGLVDMEDFAAKLDDDVAVFMITNPNTLGLFEPNIRRIADMVHARGGLVYLDGANMNAILGIARPGDFGADMMHFNVHKTFTGPHGAGGPGSGPIAVRAMLEPFLPMPRILAGADGTFRLDENRPLSIGRVRSFHGNIGVILRGYFYIRTLGAEGLANVSRHAVLNARYLRSLLAGLIEIPGPDNGLHEFVASARNLRREKRVSAMDIAKRLLDHGFHSPTVYFPLVVPEALMMEPTETESPETLEAFAKALGTILVEDPEILRQAPHSLPISRPDEVKATKEPVLRWKAD